jgi:DNA polymerase
MADDPSDPQRAAARLEHLRAEAKACTRCDLYQRATQTVFGQGPPSTRVVMVGEQPGDREDLVGRPFVGPAGEVLDRALTSTGIDRGQLYLTNAVKHFKWVPKGRRRIHQTPNETEVAACMPWLEAEVEAIGPEVVVALGATAGQALLGPEFRVTRQRGQVIDATIGGWTGPLVATTHPSAILRVPDAVARAEALAGFERDLRVVANLLGLA